MSLMVGDRIRFVMESHRNRGVEGIVHESYGDVVEINWDDGFGPNGWGNPDIWPLYEGAFEIIARPNDWDESLELT